MLKAINLTGQPVQKKALLAYLESPVQRSLSGERMYPFSNLGLAVELVRGLNACGYGVDVVNWDASKLPKGKTYDLFVGHGGVTFNTIQKQNNLACSIYFASGSAAEFHNREARKRSRDFFKRQGVAYQPDRPVDPAEQATYLKANTVICLGNNTIAKTFPQKHPVYNLNIAASKKAFIPFETFGRSPKHLLFFSGGGNLHKGLDLAIEAVIGTDLSLHICTSIDKKFQAVYEEKYTPEQLKNIRFHGFVAQNSHLFRKLIRKCQFAILLSCSEGSPGSLIDVMQYGLLPIITPACGLDIGDTGIVIKNLAITSIREEVEAITSLPRGVLNKKAGQVRAQILDQYSLERFRTSFEAAVRNSVA